MVDGEAQQGLRSSASGVNTNLTMFKKNPKVPYVNISPTSMGKKKRWYSILHSHAPSFEVNAPPNARTPAHQMATAFSTLRSRHPERIQRAIVPLKHKLHPLTR